MDPTLIWNSSFHEDEWKLSTTDIIAMLRKFSGITNLEKEQVVIRHFPGNVFYQLTNEGIIFKIKYHEHA